MRFQILALSGGGYLGLYTAKILAELEQRASRPLGQCFDLVCGTSIGGILALGLGAEVSAAEMVSAFEEHGEAIFSGRPRPAGGWQVAMDIGRSLRGPKYSGHALRETIGGLVGDRLLGESLHRLLIPAVNITSGKARMFKTGHRPDYTNDHRVKMVDIGMATSAAPTFFPPVDIDGSLYADGGLFANAPDQCGLHEATCFLEQDVRDVHVLSIGTTTTNFGRPDDRIGRMGAFRWLGGARLFATMIGAQQQVTDWMMQHRLEARYVRLDTPQTEHQAPLLALDVATTDARQMISNMASETLRTQAGTVAVRDMLAHAPGRTTFYNTQP